jgi:hypothetical protein
VSRLPTPKRGTVKPDPEKIPERDKGKAREKAAAAAHVSPRYVQDAKMLSEKAPELAEAVKNGNLAIPEAGPLQECGTRPAPGALTLAHRRGALEIVPPRLRGVTVSRSAYDWTSA